MQTKKFCLLTILTSLSDFTGSTFSPINNITAANDCSYFRSLIPCCIHPVGIFSGSSIRPGSANLWEYFRRCVPTLLNVLSSYIGYNVKANLHNSLLTDDLIKLSLCNHDQNINVLSKFATIATNVFTNWKISCFDVYSIYLCSLYIFLLWLLI